MKNLILLLFAFCFVFFSTNPVKETIQKEKGAQLEMQVNDIPAVSNDVAMIWMELTPVEYECELISTQPIYLIENVSAGFSEVDESPPINICKNVVDNNELKTEKIKALNLSKEFNFTCNRFLI